MGYISRPYAGDAVRRPPLAGPLYLQIHEDLRARIAAGEWTSDAMLPNEVDFAREYGVSIGTMRKALDRLGQARLIVRKQGRGTYVRKQAANPLARFTRWHVKDTDSTSSERVLSVKVVRPTPADIQRLRLLRPDAVLKVETLGWIGATCCVFNTYTLAQSRSDAAFDSATELQEPALEQVKLATTRAMRCIDRVTAAKANAAQARTLEIAEGEPVLCVARVGLDADERSIFSCDSVAHMAKGAAYSPDLD